MAIGPFTILIDDREKQALVFPRFLVVSGSLFSSTHKGGWPPPRTIELRTHRTRLETGDYVMVAPDLPPQEACRGVVVERKKNMQEIASNLHTSDRRRFLRTLDRLAAARSPYIFVEQPIGMFLRRRRGFPDPHALLSDLLSETIQRRIPVLFLGSGSVRSRLAIGSWLASLLVAGHIKGLDAMTGAPSGAILIDEAQAPEN